MKLLLVHLLCNRNESRNMVSSKQRYHKACIGFEEAENSARTSENCGNLMEKVVDVQGSQDLLISQHQMGDISAVQSQFFFILSFSICQQQLFSWQICDTNITITQKFTCKQLSRLESPNCYAIHTHTYLYSTLSDSMYKYIHIYVIHSLCISMYTLILCTQYIKIYRYCVWRRVINIIDPLYRKDVSALKRPRPN